jgi:hypothetical protein
VTVIILTAVLSGVVIGVAAPDALAIGLSSGATLAACVALGWMDGISLLAAAVSTFAALAAHQTAFLTAALVHGARRARAAAQSRAIDDELATAPRDLASVGATMRAAGGRETLRRSG